MALLLSSDVIFSRNKTKRIEKSDPSRPRCTETSKRTGAKIITTRRPGNVQKSGFRWKPPTEPSGNQRQQSVGIAPKSPEGFKMFFIWQDPHWSVLNRTIRSCAKHFKGSGERVSHNRTYLESERQQPRYVSLMNGLGFHPDRSRQQTEPESSLRERCRERVLDKSD